MVPRASFTFGEQVQMKSMMQKINIWSLYYRQEIVWFIAGLVMGVIIL